MRYKYAAINRLSLCKWPGRGTSRETGSQCSTQVARFTAARQVLFTTTLSAELYLTSSREIYYRILESKGKEKRESTVLTCVIMDSS